MVLAVGGWLVAAAWVSRRSPSTAPWDGPAWLSGLLLAGSFVHVHPGDHAHQRRQCRRAAERGAARLGGARPRLPEARRWRRRRSLRFWLAVAGVALMFAGALGGGDLVGNALALGVAIAVRRQHRGGAGGARARPGAGDGAGGTVRHVCHAAAGERRCPVGLRSRAAGGDGRAAAGARAVPVHARRAASDGGAGRAADAARGHPGADLGVAGVRRGAGRPVA